MRVGLQVPAGTGHQDQRLAADRAGLQDPEVRRRNLITDAELAAIPHGALVVWTSNDPSGPAATGMDMAKKIHGGRFQHITGAGHWPQWEQRDVFNTLVLGFLGEASTP